MLYIVVDNIGNPPNIAVECGSVDASGLKLKDKPPTLSETQAPSISRTRIPNDPRNDRWFNPEPPFHPMQPSRNLRSDFESYLRMDDMEADEGPFDDAPDRMLPPVNHLSPLGGPPPPLNRPLPPRNFPPENRLPPPRSRAPPQDIGGLKINLPDTPAPRTAIISSVNNNGPIKKQPIAKAPPAKRKPAPPRNQQTQRKINPTLQTQTNVRKRGPGIVRQRNNNPIRPAANNGRIKTKKLTPKKITHEQDDVSSDTHKDANDNGK